MVCPVMTAKEVAMIMDCSERYGYDIIKKLNDELIANGFIVRPGRVSRKYFFERTGLETLEGERRDSQ